MVSNSYYKVRFIAAMQKKRDVSKASLLNKYQSIIYFPNLIEACAAANLAIGTLNGEQLT
jgi:hypothetical protein